MAESLYPMTLRRFHCSGVMRLYEKKTDEIERLFCEAVFALDEGDISKCQDHMDVFLDGYERIRADQKRIERMK